MNNNRCRYLWSIFNAKGWKKKEPIDIPRESTTLLEKMVKALIEHLDYDKNDIANMFSLDKGEMELMYFLPPTSKLKVA